MENNITGTRIRKLRKEKGLTGDQLGQVLGCTKTAISYWETGRVKVDDVTLVKLAKYFNVTTDYLLGNDTKRNRSTEAHDFDMSSRKLDDNMRIVFSAQANLDDEDIEQIKQYIEFIKTRKKNK